MKKNYIAVCLVLFITLCTAGISSATSTPYQVPTNLASSSATATASSQFMNDPSNPLCPPDLIDKSALKAVDTWVDGLPTVYTCGDVPAGNREWATNGVGVGAWLRLDWLTPQYVRRVVLYDRINLNDQITSATLTSSDGLNQSGVGPLPDDGTTGFVVDFATPRQITWMQMTVDEVKPGTGSAGLAEIEVISAQLIITPPAITLSKQYDGTTTAAVTAGTLTGVLAGDTVTVIADANYDTPAVGTGKNITVVYTLGGAAAGKYIKPVNYVVSTGEITAKQLTITNPALTLSKPYDGTTTAAVTAGTLSGKIGSDDVSISTTVATYDTAAVGTNKTITVVYTLAGAQAGNYIKPVNYVVTNGVITAKQLTITDPALTLSKPYDGTTTAAVTAGTLSGKIGSEDVSISTTVATYDTAAVGTNKTITVVYTLAGAQAGNYIKPVNYVVTNGVITAKQLTITDPALTLSKPYDGTTTAAVTAGTLSGKIGSEDVSISTTVATYDTAAVGTNKTITVVYTLAGAQAGNYIKPVNYVVTNGVITAKQLTISAPTLTLTKPYDGTTTAAVTAGTLSGKIGSEDVSISTTVATYDTAAVGTNKTITVVYTLAGAQAGNYIKPVNYVVTNGVITAKQLTITDPALTLSKPYDGTTTAAVTAGTLSGKIGSEDVSISTTVATYDTAAVGTNKTITVVYTLAGAQAGNYIKPVNYVVTNGVITAKQLTITDPALTLSKPYDGTTTAAVTAGTLSGKIGSEDVSISTTVATYDTAAVGTNKTITVVYTLGGAAAGNYIKPVNYIVSTGVITTGAIQLTISAPTLTLTKPYDGTTTAAVTPGTLTGVVVGDIVTVSAVANYATAAVGTNKTITVVYTLAGADAGNYVKPVNDVVSTGVITAIQLTIAAPALTLTKPYNGTTTAAVTPGTLSGKIGSDDVTVSAAANYDTAAVGTGKTITVVYTLGGAAAGNYIKPVNYIVSNGEITTATISNNLAIQGVTAPVTGAIPVKTATATDEYEAPGVGWSPAVPTTFAGSTVYTATIYITPTASYTLTGVAANSFTVAGATTVTNPVDSGVVTAVFPETAACSYSLSKSSDAFLAAGGSGSITVTTSVTDCEWTASTADSWIHVTSGASGTGNGTVEYSVDANGGPSSRSGKITVGSETLTIIQTPPSATCTYVIAPYNATHSKDAGTGSVTVTADAGCDWTASSNVSWIQVTDGASGTGPGTVDYHVDANTASSSRMSTVTIAGWTFTITQDGTSGSTADKSASATSSDAVIATATVIETNTAYGEAPAGFTPKKALSFTATNTTLTPQICFSFTTLPASPVFYKVVNDGTWYQIYPANQMSSLGLTGVSLDGTAKKLCFTITDDSLADGCKLPGIIQDPIFCTVANTTTTIHSDGGGGGGGGGNSTTTTIPAVTTTTVPTTTTTVPAITTTTTAAITTTTTTASAGCQIKSIQPSGVKIGFGLLPRIRRVTLTMNTDLESLGITCADLNIQNAPRGAYIISCAVSGDSIEATILFWGLKPGTYNIDLGQGQCGSIPFVVSRF